MGISHKIATLEGIFSSIGLLEVKKDSGGKTSQKHNVFSGMSPSEYLYGGYSEYSYLTDEEEMQLQNERDEAEYSRIERELENSKIYTSGSILDVMKKLNHLFKRIEVIDSIYDEETIKHNADNRQLLVPFFAADIYEFSELSGRNFKLPNGVSKTYNINDYLVNSVHIDAFHGGEYGFKEEYINRQFQGEDYEMLVNHLREFDLYIPEILVAYEEYLNDVLISLTVEHVVRKVDELMIEVKVAIRSFIS